MCGHTGSDVHEEQDKIFSFCCEDYTACEKRRTDVAAEIYRQQFSRKPHIIPELTEALQRVAESRKEVERKLRGGRVKRITIECFTPKYLDALRHWLHDRGYQTEIDGLDLTVHFFNLLKQKGRRKMTEGEALLSIGIKSDTQEGKPGIRLPTGQFIPASDERPDCIVAGTELLKFSKETVCADCGTRVAISHNTQLMLVKYPGTPVICIECMMKRVEKEKTDGEKVS